MPWGFAIGAAGAIGSSLIGASASQGAAQTQAGSADAATALQQQMFNQSQANVAPWISAGQGSLAQLQRALGLPVTGGGAPITQTGTTPSAAVPTTQTPINPNMPGVSPGSPFFMPPTAGGTGSMAALQGAAMRPTSGVPTPGARPPSTGTDLTSILQSTPGYQWDVSQGQQAILDQASALGGVNSGATLKALSDYTSNQAQNTYQSYLQNLFGISNTGANAALGQSGIGAQVGGQIGGNIIGAGNALAAGQIGSANAISGGLGGLYNQYLMSQALQGGGGGLPNYLNTPTVDPSVFAG